MIRLCRRAKRSRSSGAAAREPRTRRTPRASRHRRRSGAPPSEPFPRGPRGAARPRGAPGARPRGRRGGARRPRRRGPPSTEVRVDGALRVAGLRRHRVDRGGMEALVAKSAPPRRRAPRECAPDARRGSGRHAYREYADTVSICQPRSAGLAALLVAAHPRPSARRPGRRAAVRSGRAGAGPSARGSPVRGRWRRTPARRRSPCRRRRRSTVPSRPGA